MLAFRGVGGPLRAPRAASAGAAERHRRRVESTSSSWQFAARALAPTSSDGGTMLKLRRTAAASKSLPENDIAAHCKGGAIAQQSRSRPLASGDVAGTDFAAGRRRGGGGGRRAALTPPLP